MGKYDFGARVRDFEGDEGYIVGKKKGRRQVKFDDDVMFDAWLDKSDLTVLAAPALVGKIVEGGTYLSRHGETFGPMERDGNDSYPWSYSGMIWRDDGSYFRYVHDLDLVVELSAPEKTDEKSEAKTGFKVGDRVEFTDACPSEWWFGPEKKYRSGVIVRCEIHGSHKHGVQTDNGIGYVNDEHIRLATAEPKFKVGDKVRFNTKAPAHSPQYTDDVLTVIKVLANGDVDIKYPDGIVQVTTPESLSLVTETPDTSTPVESHIVCRMFKGQPRPNGKPYVHATLSAAETEAQRLADLHGGEFAVYSRSETKTVDAGPVPDGFHIGNAKSWLNHGEGTTDEGGLAFYWAGATQGFRFWESNFHTLTPKGRAILTKWLAEAEATLALEAT